MNYAFFIDNSLPTNLATRFYSTEQHQLNVQKDLLSVAFEQKIRKLSKDQLLAMKFCIRAYIELEPGADNDIHRAYLELINLYLKKCCS